MIRKELFVDNNLKYDENCLVEDLELWSRCSALTRFYNLSEELLLYRVVDNSLSHNSSRKVKFDLENKRIIKNTITKKMDIEVNDHEITLHCGEIQELYSLGVSSDQLKSWVIKLNSALEKSSFLSKKIIRKYTKNRWYSYFYNKKEKRLKYITDYLSISRYIELDWIRTIKLILIYILKR